MTGVTRHALHESSRLSRPEEEDIERTAEALFIRTLTIHTITANHYEDLVRSRSYFQRWTFGNH